MCMPKRSSLASPGRADCRPEAGCPHVDAREGSLKLRIERVLPLTDVRNAHVAIESRQTTGKWLLIP